MRVFDGVIGANRGGYIEQNSREYLTHNISRTTSLDGLSNLVVATTSKGQISAKQRTWNSHGSSSAKMRNTWVSRRSLFRSRSNLTSIQFAHGRSSRLLRNAPALQDRIRADEALFRQANFIEALVGRSYFLNGTGLCGGAVCVPSHWARPRSR